jgi:hypothetical protein
VLFWENIMALLNLFRRVSNVSAHAASGSLAPSASIRAKESAPVQPGSCRLEAGQAITMRARQAGQLRVVQGRLWITFSNAAQDARVRAGDHFLLPGQSLAVSAGETVVMESWAVGQPVPAWVCWEPAPVPRLMPVFFSARRAGHGMFLLSQ